MFRNYLKIAFRSLLKNKTFSFINIIGLSVGTLCCLYIVLYVLDQYSYDKHHQDRELLYRINSDITFPGGHHDFATASPPIAPAMKQDFSEVLQYTRVVSSNGFGASQHLLRYEEKSIYEKEVIFTDSTFFDLFSYHFVHGNAGSALREPYTVVLHQTLSEKLFGSGDPVGKVIELNHTYGKNDFKITGVVNESLGKSHIGANLFITMNSGGIGEYTLRNDSWAGNNFVASYIKLNPHGDVKALEQKLPALLQKYGVDQLRNLGMKKTLSLQAVGSIHTNASHENEMGKTVSRTFLSMMLLIAGLIQLIACINFMNLSTARASKRAREVGVRKVIGADRTDLIQQFLSESLVLTILSTMIAILFLKMGLPWLNAITSADIRLSLFTDWKILVLLLGIILVTGLLAGSYPAFYLSAFRAIKVIKGNFTSHISAAGIRRSLVVLQFTLSIALIIGIIVIYSQMEFVRNKNLGFEKEQKLIFTFHTGEAMEKLPAFADALRGMAEVKAVSRANNYFSQFIRNDWIYSLQSGNTAESQNVKMLYTDEHFLKATGVQLLSGRDFRIHDTGRVLINETLARRFGLDPATAAGTRLYPKLEEGEKPYFREVIGVIRDVNISSLKDDIRPFMLSYNDQRDDRSHLIVNLASDRYDEALKKMGDLWKSYFPGVPNEYVFLDEALHRQYESESTLVRILNTFALFAILISGLGLFGLAAFSAEQRTKEIGIRKVLGATVGGIVQLLSKDFLKLVAIALVIASPLAWYATNKWLQGFAYKIEISWWMFALAGGLAILIALVTVSFQALKAALSNPVKSLRTE